jgi:chromosome segregation ATPase
VISKYNALVERYNRLNDDKSTATSEQSSDSDDNAQHKVDYERAKKDKGTAQSGFTGETNSPAEAVIESDSDQSKVEALRSRLQEYETKLQRKDAQLQAKDNQITNLRGRLTRLLSGLTCDPAAIDSTRHGALAQWIHNELPQRPTRPLVVFRRDGFGLADQKVVEGMLAQSYEGI